MIEKIIDAVGADLSDQAVGALFRSLRGLDSSNAHKAAEPILSVINSKPESFAVSDPDEARKVLGELLGVRAIVVKGGVGTELSKLIPDWAVQFKGGCGCKDMAKKMDDRGVEWCELNKNAIVAHLMSQSDHLIPAFKLVPDALKKVAAERMLNKAIRAAKA